MAEDIENIADMERHDTSTKLPIGWVVLYVGLILWGIYYTIAYTPQISGWTQEGAYLESLKK